MQAKRINVVLFECQVDLILKSLELYRYDINEKYSNRKISKSKAENSEKSLIYDTYHQLLACKNEKTEKISKHA